MDSGTILGIVAAIVVVAVLVWWLVSRGDKEQLPMEPRKPEQVPDRERRPKQGKEAAKNAAPTGAEKPEAAGPPPPKAAEEKPAEELEAPAETGKEPAAEPPKSATERDKPPAAAAKPSEEELKALKKGLASTRGGFISRLAKLFGRKEEIDPELLDEVQEVLITADIGVHTSERILQQLKERMERHELSNEDKIWQALREEAQQILDVPGAGVDLSKRPSVVLVVGVNGVGKTTTIGKLASRYKEHGKTVILAAGDTFRAAAVLQLEVWGRRVGCDVVKGKERADPASVIFDAIKRAQDEEADVVIADTAGRLHTKTNLMEELKKVVRTSEKALGRPVDEILLVLDSTTGQNAIQQAQMFKDAIDVSGIALTKLDGTAKGGVILGIVDEHKLPVHFVGIGERVEDLRAFDTPTFVQALFTKPDDETLAA